MSAGNMGASATAGSVARSGESEFDSYQIQCWAVLGGLVLALVWCYWNTLLNVAREWDNPKYSHGYLVPVFTMALLWMRREPFIKPTNSARWAGVGLIAVGLLARLGLTWLSSSVPEMYTMLPCFVGAFLIVGGWPTLRWAAPAVLFLFFMFPLPSFLDGELLGRLQAIATRSSTYLLQTLGVACYSEGKRIVIGELQMGVVEACSGLRMLTIFVALAVAITLVTDRPMWERAVIVASAVPIALLVNIIRITVTGVLHLTVGTEIADKVFHDLAGWVMMPMALGFLYVEFQILSHLVIDDGPSGPVRIGMGPGTLPPRAENKGVVKPVA
jgi:exosortase